MQLNRPFQVVGPTIDGDVLGVLALAEAEFTPPRVQSILGQFSEAGIRKALNRLAGQGIVRSRRAGNAVLYGFNRNHLAAPAIVALARLRDTFIEQLRHEFERWTTPCSYAALFGSAARGGMRPDSDVDVFVVRPSATRSDAGEWQDEIGELSVAITEWTGNDARVLEYSDDEVARGLRAGDRVLAEIVRDAIHLAGPEDYLRRARKAH
jgi:predicted nucleotidyltransferase